MGVWRTASEKGKNATLHPPTGPMGATEQYFNYSGWILDVTYLATADFITGILSTLRTRECSEGQELKPTLLDWSAPWPQSRP